MAHELFSIILHEDWKYDEEDFDADISLLVLRNKVELHGGFVRIICLPKASENEVSGTGNVVGWGVSERSIANGEFHDSTPNEVRLPVVTREKCIKADYRFEEISSSRTFCAGFVNQNKSMCAGDSGSGFFMFDSSTKTFSVAGIVSSSLRDEVGQCRIDVYSIFTDVTKYLTWIEDKMRQTDEIDEIFVDFECEKA